MQRINKTEIKRKFAYTWYTYFIGIGLSFFCWFWAFQAYHQPSAHQKIVLFTGADIKDESFSAKILNKFDTDKLRLFDANGCSPKRGTIYASKLNVYLNNADLMILPEETVNSFTNNDNPEAVMDNYFRPFTDEIKTTYLNGSESFVSITKSDSTVVDYGVLIKNNSVESWLSNYINFENDVNYYLMITACSTNTGTLYSNDNADYTNALQAIKYLMEGVE